MSRPTLSTAVTGYRFCENALGRHCEARTEFERAAALTRNTRERDLLLTRAASCETDPTNP